MMNKRLWKSWKFWGVGVAIIAITIAGIIAYAKKEDWKWSDIISKSTKPEVYRVFNSPAVRYVPPTANQAGYIPAHYNKEVVPGPSGLLPLVGKLSVLFLLFTAIFHTMAWESRKRITTKFVKAIDYIYLGLGSLGILSKFVEISVDNAIRNIKATIPISEAMENAKVNSDAFLKFIEMFPGARNLLTEYVKKKLGRVPTLDELRAEFFESGTPFEEFTKLHEISLLNESLMRWQTLYEAVGQLLPMIAMLALVIAVSARITKTSIEIFGWHKK